MAKSYKIFYTANDVKSCNGFYISSGYAFANFSYRIVKAQRQSFVYL